MKTRKFYKTKRKGFTLAEVIVSVAIMAIFSVYILKMFISANSINTKANELDQALSIAQNYLTLIQEEDDISNPDINFIGDVVTTKTANGFVHKIFLDKSFSPVNEIEASYVLIGNYSEINKFANNKVLYDVRATLESHTDAENLERIIEIGTKMIFPVQEEL